MSRKSKPVSGKDRDESKLVWSRGLSWEEIDQLTEWFYEYRRFHRGKFLRNHKKAVREIKDYLNMDGVGCLPPSNNVRFHVDSDISPELAVLFKLTWG